MSVLEISGRPYIVFDPSNREHRGFYHEFVKTGTWGRCPFRFVVQEDKGDLITMMQRALVKFYTESEFKTVARKAPKTVDTKPKR